MPLLSLLVMLDRCKLLGLEPFLGEVLSGSVVISLGASSLDAVVGVIGTVEMNWLRSSDCVGLLASDTFGWISH